MTNSANGIQREIKVKGQKLGPVTSFKYPWAVVSDDGAKPDIVSRVAQATAAITKMKPIWRNYYISSRSKVKLSCYFHISVWLWIMNIDCRVREKNASLWDKMLQGLLNISSNDHITNAEVCRKIQAAIGEYDELLALVKKRKLRWFGHVSRSSGLTKTILQGTVKRQTEKVGRQYQSVDRNGLCQLN